jgi:demethylmenaquinone methyltransferase/2-methoxy-6-polyprenyl-1,4-benzoquinol methylase
MFSFVFMKILESTPERYDWGINLFSLGRITAIKEWIVNNYINKGDRVLDVGCGTGTLAVMMARKGALVKGIDISKQMLSVADGTIKTQGLENHINLMETSIVGLGKYFKDESIDTVISTLVFSELSTDERIYVLEESRRILRGDGLLIIADETRPRSVPGRLIYALVRIPLAVLTFIFTQSIFHSVKDLEKSISNAGFRIISNRKQFLGAFETIIAQKGT